MEKRLLPENFLNILSNIYEHFMTYRKNFLLPGFLQLCAQHVPDRLQPVLAAFGVSTTDMLIDAVKSLTADTVQLSENDAAAYAAKAICAKNVPQVLWPLTESEEYTIYKSLVH